MASEYYYVFVGDPATNNIEESVPPSRESYTWTDTVSLRLIRFRTEFKELFTRKKGSATIGYKKIAAILGIGAENYHCVKKKWENLVDKYRQEIRKIVMTESEEFPVLTSTWKFYDAMSEALGLESEKKRVRLSMMGNTNCNSVEISTAPLVANALELHNESSISNNEHTSSIHSPEQQMCDTSPYNLSTEIKIETNEFEFDKIFEPEEHEDKSMLQCTPIDNLLQKTELSAFNNADNNVMHNLNVESNILHVTNNSAAANNSSRELLPTHLRSILKSNVTTASTSQTPSTSKTSGITAGIIQSRPRITVAPAVSDAASSYSSDDVAYTPYNKKSTNTKRARKRKSSPDNDELLEFIKKGDEDLRKDFKQLIEIQRKTSEHIGALVNYLIHKDSK